MSGPCCWRCASDEVVEVWVTGTVMAVCGKRIAGTATRVNTLLHRYCAMCGQMQHVRPADQAPRLVETDLHCEAVQDSDTSQTIHTMSTQEPGGAA